MPTPTKRQARARLSRLPTSPRFWRSWLTEPALDIHGLTDEDSIEDQLRALRETGVTAHEAFAVVWWHIGTCQTVLGDRVVLGRMAGELIIQQNYALASDGKIPHADAAMVDAMWIADLKAADL